MTITTMNSAPIALAREVLPGNLMRAGFNNHELVLWRDDNDNIQVWKDRCPHRSIRLSAGRNLGDGVQCVYHGWKFNCNGYVTDIPAERGKTLPKIKVAVFISKTVDGFVWVTTDEEVHVPSEFAPGKNDVLLRPIPVNAAANKTQELLDEEYDLSLIAASTTQNSCTIFGYAPSCNNKTAFETAHYWNSKLTATRRSLEIGMF